LVLKRRVLESAISLWYIFCLNTANIKKDIWTVEKQHLYIFMVETGRTLLVLSCYFDIYVHNLANVCSSAATFATNLNLIFSLINYKSFLYSNIKESMYMPTP